MDDDHAVDTDHVVDALRRRDRCAGFAAEADGAVVAALAREGVVVERGTCEDQHVLVTEIDWHVSVSVSESAWDNDVEAWRRGTRSGSLQDGAEHWLHGQCLRAA